MNVSKKAMELIACAVFDKAIDLGKLENLSEGFWSNLYLFANSHDMAHIVGYSLDRFVLPTVSVDERSLGNFKNKYMLSVVRFKRIEHELLAICDSLSRAQIVHVPLKGAVMRSYYKEPWMRTSCDIDVLVHSEDVHRAADALVEALGYEKKSTGSHDISLFSPSGVHLELHYDLIEDEILPSADAILGDIWSFVSTGDGYTGELTKEMFVFYHVAHMAKHFVKGGGCGIRSVLDLKILNERMLSLNDPKLNNMLAEGGLNKFATTMLALSDVWFGDGVGSEEIADVEQFLLKGGVGGTMENRVAVQQVKQGGKFKYALSKIFIPYDVIKFQYPALQKHKWLMPACQVRRWFRIIFRGGVKRSARELSRNYAITDSEVSKTTKMLKELGLE